MPKRTQLLKVLPWIGGLNTSRSESLIQPQELVEADQVVFGASDVKLKREGIDFDFDDGSNTSNSVIGLHDYHFDSGLVRDTRLVAVDTAGNVTSLDKDSGVRTDLTARPEIVTVQYDDTGTTYDVSGDGLHYFINDPTTEYYVWHNVTDGANTQNDPNVSGKTGIQVDILQADSANTIAGKAQTAIDAELDFGAAVSTDTVTITNANNGAATDAADVDASVIITTTQQGVSAWTTPDRVSMVTINNLALMASNGQNNDIKYWDGSISAALELKDHPLYTSGDALPPEASILRIHLGRVWTNDKNDKDRLHFSETFNPFKWQGFGDSGAIDIGRGDGDSDGIIAIFPTFQGELFVAKKTKLYRISGFSPETFSIQKVSDSLGAESHNSVIAVDTDEIYWLSKRGIHSLNTTSNFGDFDNTFVSKPIQKTFNEDFSKSSLDDAWGAYLPQINSIAFAVRLTRKSENNDLFLYNIPLQAWYTWKNVSCTSIVRSEDSDGDRFYLGTSVGRIAKTFTGALSDTDNTGTSKAIFMALKTGMIHPDGNEYTIKGYKKFSLVFKPSTSATIVVGAKIDNFPSQSFSFSNINEGDILGVDFTLGSSILGFSQVMAAFTESLDGYGRGIQFEICQSGTDEATEIQGFMIEYEGAGDSQEVLPG